MLMQCTLKTHIYETIEVIHVTCSLAYAEHHEPGQDYDGFQHHIHNYQYHNGFMMVPKPWWAGAPASSMYIVKAITVRAGSHQRLLESF